MSWLVANWFGVCVIFGAPATVGILGWIVRAYAGGDGDRRAREREREREAGRHAPHALSRHV